MHPRVAIVVDASILVPLVCSGVFADLAIPATDVRFTRCVSAGFNLCTKICKYASK